MTTARITFALWLVGALMMGAATGWLVGSGHADAAADWQNAEPAAAASSSTSGQPDVDWVAWVRSASWHEPDGAQTRAALQALVIRPDMVDAALARFRSEPQGQAKDNLLQFLTARPIARVKEQAFAWIADAADSATQQHGFLLLHGLPPSPEGYRAALAAIRGDADPGLMGAALLALGQTGPPDPELAQQIIPRLHQLTSHASPNVRGLSIQRLAEWDRAEQYVVEDVMRLIDDPDGDVRLAAIGATSIAMLKTQALKERLLKLMGDPGEPIDHRGTAAMQMHRFALLPAEHRAYLKAERQLTEASREARPP